ncbi:MAG: hypothetical protein E4H01_15155 [Lysobacterales bacterium]|nr:MAG: hypothetical protein E4H01_15155 [Xanthomonadales bacterium]
MTRSKNPVLVIISMALVWAFVCAMVRFGYLAYVIAQAGESLGSVPVNVLLMDIMGLHWFALYGAGGGAIFGIVLVVVDLFRYGGREGDLSWKSGEEINPFAGDEVKARRMETGDRYLKGRESTGEDDEVR